MKVVVFSRSDRCDLYERLGDSVTIIKEGMTEKAIQDIVTERMNKRGHLVRTLEKPEEMLIVVDYDSIPTRFSVAGQTLFSLCANQHGLFTRVLFWYPFPTEWNV